MEKPNISIMESQVVDVISILNLPTLKQWQKNQNEKYCFELLHLEQFLFFNIKYTSLYVFLKFTNKEEVAFSFLVSNFTKLCRL